MSYQRVWQIEVTLRLGRRRPMCLTREDTMLYSVSVLRYQDCLILLQHRCSFIKKKILSVAITTSLRCPPSL